MPLRKSRLRDGMIGGVTRPAEGGVLPDRSLARRPEQADGVGSAVGASPTPGTKSLIPHLLPIAKTLRKLYFRNED